MRKQTMISLNTVQQYLMRENAKELIERYEEGFKKGDPISFKEYKEIVKGDVQYRSVFN
jgi:ribosomal protein S17E